MKNTFLVTLLFLSGCAQTTYEESPLEKKYIDDYYGATMFYSQAVWYSAVPEHEFAIKRRTIYLYHHHPRDEDEPFYAWVNFSECNGIEDAIKSLRSSSVESISQIAGVTDTPMPDTGVLDGDWMRLRMRHDLAGYFELNGDSGTFYTVPWIKKAQGIFELAYECATTKS